MSTKRKFNILKKSALKRNIAVSLNYKLYSDLLDLGCMYCGTELHSSSGYGLDRIDNTRGYTFDNVTPCCGTCNRAKGVMSTDEFITWIKRASSFMERKIQELSEVSFSTKEIRKSENIILNSSKYRNSDKLEVDGIRK